MTTPTAGTVQAHLEVESQTPARRCRLTFAPHLTRELYCKIPSYIILGIIFSGPWFGRAVLDAHHWKYSLPPVPPNPDGTTTKQDGDSITAAIAGVIAVPGFSLIPLLGVQLDTWFRNKEGLLVFLGIVWTFGNGLASVAASGAAMHARFDYINAISMMGLFGIGTDPGSIPSSPTPSNTPSGEDHLREDQIPSSRLFKISQRRVDDKEVLEGTLPEEVLVPFGAVTALGLCLKFASEDHYDPQYLDEETIQKALRAIDDQFTGFAKNDFVEDIDEELVNPTDPCILAVSTTFCRGYSVDKVWQMTIIDKWFLNKLHQIIQVEGQLSHAFVTTIPANKLKEAK
ncbi:hypothetical protein DL96DRAFT_1821002 [Flagelloscypha sp. PMI_526]|nr:hypothetical protein DL96DRAFT_1821002 [Flagelloscypha sp. PMI_526]